MPSPSGLLIGWGEFQPNPELTPGARHVSTRPGPAVQRHARGARESNSPVTQLFETISEKGSRGRDNNDLSKDGQEECRLVSKVGEG